MHQDNDSRKGMRSDASLSFNNAIKTGGIQSNAFESMAASSLLQTSFDQGSQQIVEANSEVDNNQSSNNQANPGMLRRRNFNLHPINEEEEKSMETSQQFHSN